MKLSFFSVKTWSQITNEIRVFGSLLQLALQKERTEEETSLSDRTCRKIFAARPQSITGEGGGGVAVIHFNSIRKDKKLFFHLY